MIISNHKKGIYARNRERERERERESSHFESLKK